MQMCSFIGSGPSLSLGDVYGRDRWSFTATARARYALRLAHVDLFAGYEHHTAVAGISVSLKWSR